MKGIMTSITSTHLQVERRTSSVLRERFTPMLRRTAWAALLPVALLCAGRAAGAQDTAVAALASDHPVFTLSPATYAATESSTSTEALPDDPSLHLSAVSGVPAAPQLTPQAATTAGPVSPKYDMTISSGFKAQPLTNHEKVVLGLRDMYSPLTFAGEITAAGYSHLTNGQPNYGTDKGAFGQRLGASVLRDISEELFSEAILPPLLHEDIRYYVEGPRYNFFHRTLYSITRPIITRTDSGKSTINASLLIGYAGASALTYTYYPPVNQNFKDMAETFGGGVGGSALGYFVTEFADDVLQALHLEKKR
jgi:hypothetical protein